MVAPTLPVALDSLVVALAAVGAHVSPVLALVAIVAGGLLVLAGDGAAPFTAAARRALALGVGGVTAAGLAHGLAMLLGPLLVAT